MSRIRGRAYAPSYEISHKGQEKQERDCAIIPHIRVSKS